MIKPWIGLSRRLNPILDLLLTPSYDGEEIFYFEPGNFPVLLKFALQGIIDFYEKRLILIA